ncbi:RHS domain-containing protein [Halomonas sp. ND22Bw]
MDHLGTPQEVLSERGDLVWATEYRVVSQAVV